MDPLDDELLRPQIEEKEENAGLDEFAGEGEPVAPPVACHGPEPAVVIGGPRPLRRGFVALLVVLTYAGAAIGLWHRAVASDQRRALASAEVPPHPSVPVAAPAPITSHATPSASIAAPSVGEPAPPPAPVPAPPTPITAAPSPPVERRPRAQAKRLAQAPVPRTASAAPRRLTAAASPSHPPSQAPGDHHAESGHDAPRAAIAAADALPAGGDARPVIEPPADIVREPPAPTIASIDPLAADRSAVVEALTAYRKSYNNLDAAAASAVWEGVDERALRRAFSSLSRQNVSFDRCDVRVAAADHAMARCDGMLSYVVKIGNTGAQQRHMTWNMDLRRTGDRWKIVSVTTR